MALALQSFGHKPYGSTVSMIYEKKNTAAKSSHMQYSIEKENLFLIPFVWLPFSLYSYPTKKRIVYKYDKKLSDSHFCMKMYHTICARHHEIAQTLFGKTE